MSGRLLARGAAVGAAAALVGVIAGLLAANAGGVLAVALAAGATLLAAGAGLLAFREPARAVGGVVEATRRFAGGELGERVAISIGPAAELTRSFNAMARAVQELLATVAAEEARLRAVVEASTDAMIAVDSETRVRLINEAAARMLETGEDVARERTLIESARDFELVSLVRRVMATGRGETGVVTFGPRRTPLRAAALPIPGGGDWSVLLILTDLTEVQRVDQLRRDFLGNVSHELRTPLAAVRALVETMRDGGVEPGAEMDEFLARLHQQVERLTTLVNEFLDLSRIESGAMSLHPEAFELRAVFAEAASLMRDRVERDGLRLEGPGGDATVEADRASVVRIVSNLLDNAIKYSPPGGVIHADVRDEGELVALEVRDEGPGISESDLPRVFERFYKGDPSRANAGVGLGLAIVKHLARAHGGTVAAASPPGRGAIFTVRLPRRFVGRREAKAPGATP